MAHLSIQSRPSIWLTNSLNPKCGELRSWKNPKSAIEASFEILSFLRASLIGNVYIKVNLYYFPRIVTYKLHYKPTITMLILAG